MTSIGSEFKTRNIEVDGTKIQLQIWDPRTPAPSYYRGTHGIIIVFDVNVTESFNDVGLGLEDIDKFAKEHVDKL
eukprot:CAMPEP_0173148914 /NCGR_PEP_ID=MMETSP1105-20130129/10010_1 /TAXON_ID=2985 /ORGANISM="Ochromonas sp., Strain BG-1" /LENGTH=74 /DNA_ID=CAMNT_0014063673 /DNA_START=46 /DNA_END=270 /DNA_ORIENTATION=-